MTDNVTPIEPELRTAIIAFYSAENFFRLRSAERQRERFDALKEAFLSEFDREASDDIFDMLMHYQDENKRAKQARERAKIERKENMPISAGLDGSTDHIESYPSGRYVLASAQNNTDVDKDFLLSLQQFCKHMDATLLIGRLTYNKQGFAQPDINGNGEQELWYDPAIANYLVEGHISLGDNFHFVADANVIPTAKNPLSGFDGITPSGIHAIIPATKIALKVSAALKNAPNKVIASTGTVTKRNYILRKTGAIAAMEHNIGAVFIDTDTGDIRHIEQMEGCNYFYDFDMRYTPKNATMTGDHVAALQFGDIHAEKMNSENLDKAVQLMKELEPANIVLHDVLDFTSRNHHNIKDPVFLHVQHVKGNSVQQDLQRVASVLDRLVGESLADCTVHVIESNHDLAINTWLKNSDFKTDPLNAITYLSCMLALYRHHEQTPDASFNMLAHAYEDIGGGKWRDNIDFHETDESVVIAGVEMGCHGHNGINGSRGSPTQFRSLGIPMNTGHTHSPGIIGKVYTAGVTACLDMDYNIGPSSWAIAHVVTYKNGQRQIIFV